MNEKQAAYLLGILFGGSIVALLKWKSGRADHAKS